MWIITHAHNSANIQPLGDCYSLGHFHILKAKAIQQSRNRRPRILSSGVQDSIRERSRLQLLLCLDPCLAFEIWVGLDQQAGCAQVHPRVLVVQRGQEEFGRRQIDVHGPLVVPVDANVLRLQLGKIDPCNRLSMADQQDLIAARISGMTGLLCAPSTTVSSE